MGKKRLTLKQKKFVQEYVKNNGNGTKAVIDAGYDVKNKQTAGTIAKENIKKPHLKKSIEEHLQEAGYNPKESIDRLRATASEGKAKKAREELNETLV